MTDMTITVPTGKAGEVAVFKVQFPKLRFDDTVEMIGLLVKPSDVLLGEKMGLWTII